MRVWVCDYGVWVGFDSRVGLLLGCGVSCWIFGLGLCSCGYGVCWQVGGLGLVWLV